MTKKQPSPPVVVYAALSKKKAKAADDAARHDEESIDSQIARVRARVELVYNGQATEVDVFHDTGHSGSKGDRGPGLKGAIAAATAAAAEHGRAELWANTSARFARGTAAFGRLALSGPCTTT